MTDHPVEIQADGLPHGHSPTMVEVIPAALHVRVPGVEAADLHDKAPGTHKEGVPQGASYM